MLPDHAPDKDEGLDTLPEPRPVYYAEQALLGALLLEPHRLPDITGVEPDSFAQHAHGALFAAIRSLPTPDPGRHAKDASWLTAVLTTARKHTRGLTASYLHTLVQVCPWPKHAPAYARMVETDHARRTLRLLAHRLKQTATDTTLPQPVSAALAEADALARCADDLAARFRAHPGSLPRTPAPPPGGTLSGHDEEALDEERSLLATAIAHPAEAEQMRWLTAQDITHPLHAGLWQCLTALTRRGAPVDPVTVLWEAQHKGLLTAEITPRELLDLLETPPGGSPLLGRTHPQTRRPRDRTTRRRAHRSVHRRSGDHPVPARRRQPSRTGRPHLAAHPLGAGQPSHATNHARLLPNLTPATGEPRR